MTNPTGHMQKHAFHCLVLILLGGVFCRRPAELHHHRVPVYKSRPSAPSRGFESANQARVGWTPRNSRLSQYFIPRRGHRPDDFKHSTLRRRQGRLRPRSQTITVVGKAKLNSSVRRFTRSRWRIAIPQGIVTNVTDLASYRRRKAKPTQSTTLSRCGNFDSGCHSVSFVRPFREWRRYGTGFDRDQRPRYWT
jgi:hypothetical protein